MGTGGSQVLPAEVLKKGEERARWSRPGDNASPVVAFRRQEALEWICAKTRIRLAFVAVEQGRMPVMEQPDQVRKETTSNGIPCSLRPCFQEYNLEALDPICHAELVIERVLAYGDRRELRWLFGYFGRTRITEWVQRMGVRRLPRRRYNLWCIVLDLGVAQRPRSEDQLIWRY